MLDHVDRAWRRAVVVVMRDPGRAVHDVMRLMHHDAVAMPVSVPAVITPVGKRGGGNEKGSGQDWELLEHLGPPFKLSATAFHAPQRFKQTDKVQHV
jgi:hypothetical protein